MFFGVFIQQGMRESDACCSVVIIKVSCYEIIKLECERCLKYYIVYELVDIK